MGDMMIRGYSGQVHRQLCLSMALVQSAAEAMANKQRANIEFILWTGYTIAFI
ncbi:hypothetical protein J6590_080943 [Homalodisca vitripennis]|nr:hypothetical protein J6590_080943 [Homalodisca vitripennis]